MVLSTEVQQGKIAKLQTKQTVAVSPPPPPPPRGQASRAKGRVQSVQPAPLPIPGALGTRRGTAPGSFPAPRRWRCPGPATRPPPALRRRPPPLHPWHACQAPGHSPATVSDPPCPEPWWCPNNKAVDGPGGLRLAIDHTGSSRRDGRQWNICNGAAQVWAARCEQPVLGSTGSHSGI